MSIASEIERLQNAKQAIKTSINNKGGTLTEEAKLDTFATAIDNLSIGETSGPFNYDTAHDYIDEFGEYFYHNTNWNPEGITSNDFWHIRKNVPRGTIVVALVLYKINLVNPSGETVVYYAPLYIQASGCIYPQTGTNYNRTEVYETSIKLSPTKTGTANGVSYPQVMVRVNSGGLYDGQYPGPRLTFVDSNYMEGWTYSFESYKVVFFQKMRIVDPS